MKKVLLHLLWPLLGLAAGVLVFASQPHAYALPEYTTRTGEACGACHVSPAGGGPRTVRGAQWVAAGRPDQVPGAPADAAPAEPKVMPSATGKAAYEKLGCAACHGAEGEGGGGPVLNTPEAIEGAETAIRDGVGSMPPYKAEILSDGDLASLMEFLHALSGGGVEEPASLAPRPLKPAESSCGGAGEGAAGTAAARSCGGN